MTGERAEPWVPCEAAAAKGQKFVLHKVCHTTEDGPRLFTMRFRCAPSVTLKPLSLSPLSCTWEFSSACSCCSDLFPAQWPVQFVSMYHASQS